MSETPAGQEYTQAADELEKALASARLCQFKFVEVHEDAAERLIQLLRAVAYEKLVILEELRLADERVGVWSARALRAEAERDRLTPLLRELDALRKKAGR